MGIFVSKKRPLLVYAQKSIVLVLLSALSFSDLATILDLSFLPNTEIAHASTGDFSIFRESSGSENLPLNTEPPFDVTWDSTVQSNGNLALQANGSDINLDEGGKYLVMYNIQAEEGTSTATQRRSWNTWLSVGGDALEYGRGSGMIRDTDNILEGYANGAAIIDTVAGDDLQVHARRFDNLTGGGVNLRADTNGISVLKLKDTWDYLRIHKSASTSNINTNTNFTGLTWDTADEVDTGSFDFTPTSADVTLKGNEGDHFLVTMNVHFNRTITNNNRENYEGRLMLDGFEISGTRVTTYTRGHTSQGDINDTVLVYSGIIQKTSDVDQTLNFEYRRESSSANGTTVIAGDRTAISIVALPEEGNYIMLGSESDTAGVSTRTGFGWDTQYEIDSYAFAHATDTNASRVEINRAGDYLFFSTLYASVSANERQPFRADWRKNGSTLLNYGGFGAYLRGNTSFTGGASGGLVMDGLLDTDYIEITHFDETEAPSDQTFLSNRVAIQGVLLDENFYGTDIVLSATSTMLDETSFPKSDVYSGGAFVIQEETTSRNITSITLTESGTVDAQTGLDNIKLFYDVDTTGADGYDCSSESYEGDETQFGATDENGFTGADGISSFTGSVPISTSQTMCVYVVYDITDAASDGETIQISIDNPSNDIDASGSPAPTIGPVTSIELNGSTTLLNAELTMSNYRWLEDDNSEGLATAVENENVSATGFSNGTIRRLRAQIDASGSTSSLPTTFQLDYATKTAACNALNTWIDVGAVGGVWDMADSGNITDGTNSTNIGIGFGGLSDPPGATFFSVNGGLRDINSETAALVLPSSQFVEFEFAIEPTVTAPQGNTYCFRFSDNGTSLRNYDVYAEATISADIDVSATSSHVTSLDVGSQFQHTGGGFIIERNGGVRTVTDITITETGSIDAEDDLSEIGLWYDLDSSAPYDCSSESFNGNEIQFGATSTSFSGANGTSTFSGSETVNNTRSMCLYVVLDVETTALDGQTIIVGISDPSTDVIVSGASVGPSSLISPSGSIALTGPVLSQTHYHWRNDDGDETDSGATSATGGVEDAPVFAVPQESNRRLRIQISNEGSVSSEATQYILEYGTKISSCEAVSGWTNVGDVDGAFDIATSTHIVDGDTTDVDNVANGAMSEENITFVGSGALREDSATTSAIALSSTQYTEIEFGVKATILSGYGTTYCFRLATDGVTPSYLSYPEFTTRDRQDFFIQRGTSTVSTTNLTLTAGADYIAPASTSSAFVRITNMHMTGAGDDIGTDAQGPDDVTAYISDQSDITNSFTITRPSGAANNTRVDWEIIEYIGLVGADNEMIVRDVGEVSFVPTEFTNSGAAISNVANASSTVIFITGQNNEDTSTQQYNDGHFTAAWDQSASSSVFMRGDADTTANLGYAVVEFTGANWKIQRKEHQYTAAGTPETEEIEVLGLPSRAFVHAQKRVGEALYRIDEGGHHVWISSVGYVSYELQSGAGTPSDHFSVAWIIENTQTGDGSMVSYQSSVFLDQPGAAEPLSTITPIGGTIGSISNASIFGNSFSSGGGNTYPRLHAALTLASTTHYEFWQSDTNNDHWYRAEVVEWPVAELAFRQNYYRFYVDNDTLTPSDAWPVGVSDLGENTSITTIDDPLGEGDRVRIRMSLHTNNATMPAEVISFKLQFGKSDESCSAIDTWVDLGNPGSAEIWRGYSATPADGTLLPSSLLTGIPNIVNLATYEDQNNTAINPNSADIGEDIEFDWLVEHNGATQLSDYCFRMIESDDTELSGYNNYPTLRTTGYTPVIANWRWFDDATSTTPVWAMAAENTAPINVSHDNEVKLRLTASEVEGAPGTNIKFKLQYSEQSDFSNGVRDVVASSVCATTATTTAQIWCYADGAGVDNAVIDTPTLTDSDSCSGGVGNGCGTHNEAPSTASTFQQSSLSNTEFEFTLQNNGARANAVYYFRMYDVTNDVSIAASSTYPSLVTAGSELEFTLSGVGSGVTSEGITSDIATTPTSIPFGTLVPNTEYEAIYRLNINTNATQGYKVLMFASQDLLNSYGDPIQNITATNDAPLSWTSGCLTSATGCFGYHAGDDTLEAGSAARFAVDNTYAAISTSTPEEVMYSSIPTDDTSDVIFKVEVSDLQPAGDYNTEIIYLAVPLF